MHDYEIDVTPLGALMDKPIPQRLRREPLVEAVWQVRFVPGPGQWLGDVLPGLLFGLLGLNGRGYQLQRLPLADMPSIVANQDPALRHAVKYRIESPSEPLLYQVGDRVLTLNCRRPYVGWTRFKASISELVARLQDSGMLPPPESQSLRYIDLLTLDEPPTLEGLRLNLGVGDHAVHRHPVQVRVEMNDGDCTHVLQVATPATATIDQGPSVGTLIDLETVATASPGDWQAVVDGLEPLHTASKTLFFRQILTPAMIARLDPEY
jgi:uncharacterized protein (TIGR04255 family)